MICVINLQKCTLKNGFRESLFNRERTDFQMEELLAIFCDIDDFCKEYEEYCTHHLLVSREEIIPQTRMYLSEIMTIVIYFHLSHYRTFKWYYKHYVEKILKPYFPNVHLQIKSKKNRK